MNIRIIGIDCAVDPLNTGISVGKTTGTDHFLEFCGCGKSKEDISAMIFPHIQRSLKSQEKTVIALDAPLGWPWNFGRSLAQHHAGYAIPADRDLFFRRATDNFIYSQIRKRPLDVTANFIARTTYSALRILAQLRSLTHHSIPLAWDPALTHSISAIEVYPAAWLISEKIEHKNYKKDPSLRAHILGFVEKLIPLRPPQRQSLILSPDVLDSLLCVLSAVDFLRNRCLGPKEYGYDMAQIRQEGWTWFKLPQARPSEGF